MKILMITPYLPYPLHSGGQTRSYNLLKYLSKKHQITLFCFIRSPQENKYVKNLENYCHKIKTFQRGSAWTPQKILRATFTFHPLLIANYYSKEIQKALQKEITNNHYDLIHTECFYLMPNVPKTALPKVLVDQTIEYKVYQHYIQTLPFWTWPIKPFLYLDVLKLYNWEKYFWKKANQTCAVSEDDQCLMKRHCSNTNIKVVRNGVNTKKFAPRKYQRASRPTILFGVANFKWMQNREAAKILLEKIWPQLKKKVKTLQLWIIGRYALDYYKKYQNEKDVTIKEADKTLPFYQKAWFMVAPIRSGGGSRTKFFEAMASGLPIITTPSGIEGIKAKKNRDVLIGKTNDDLIRKSLYLIKKRLIAREIGKSAKRLIQRHYTWEQSAEKLNEVYLDVTKNAIPNHH